MGTGWRRAFCSLSPRDREIPVAPEQQQRRRQQWGSGGRTKSGFFSGDGCSNSPTPRLHCRTTAVPSELLSIDNTSSRRCETARFFGPYTPQPASLSSVGVKGSPRLVLTRSNPASPPSPSRFALLKATLRLSRNKCGICSESVRAGQRTAIFTAECSHSFHFPCISVHVRSQIQSGLICPVCSASWRELPLFSSANFPADQPLKPDANGGGRGRSGESNPKHKFYNDDEPLLLSSSGNGGGIIPFNPIPEADHEDEVGAFSFPEPSAHAGGGSHGASGVEVALMPEMALVSADQSYQTYVVLMKVKAPALPRPSSSKVAASVLGPSCRAPIDLVTVIDVSGSMTETKLLMLKKAMRVVIASLGLADRLSMVAFSAAATKRLLPLVRMSRQGQRSARQIVDRLSAAAAAVAGGGGGIQGDRRCIGLALRKATKVLEDRRERNPVATVVLLSDRHQKPQKGEEKEDTEKHLGSATEMPPRRFGHLEIPIGISGKMTAGEGSPIEDVFSRYVSGLVSIILQDVDLCLVFSSCEIAAVYSYSGKGNPAAVHGVGDGGAASVSLGDLYAGEERELLVELRLPWAAATASGAGGLPHLSYKCRYRDPITRELISCWERSVPMPPFLPAGAQELRNLFISTRALLESRRLADLHDFETAVHLLSEVRSLLLQSTAFSSRKFVAGIEARISELQQRLRRRPPQTSSSSLSRGGADALTPRSSWRAAEQLAKVAILKKSMNRVGDLHGLENARF